MLAQTRANAHGPVLLRMDKEKIISPQNVPRSGLLARPEPQVTAEPKEGHGCCEGCADVAGGRGSSPGAGHVFINALKRGDSEEKGDSSRREAGDGDSRAVAGGQRAAAGSFRARTGNSASAASAGTGRERSQVLE